MACARGDGTGPDDIASVDALVVRRTTDTGGKLVVQAQPVDHVCLLPAVAGKRVESTH